jgi:hypothetical protein
MKPRLDADVHFVPVPGGVWVVVPGHPRLGFGIGGDGTYEWLRRIAPLLDGQQALDELTRGLDESRSERVRLLVALMQREGAVRDASDDLPHSLPDQVRRDYAEVIHYISQHADSPEYRFQLYRESCPFVIGSGLIIPPLVQALLTTGVAHVRLTVTLERPTDVDRMRECLATAFGRDAGERLEVTSMDAIAKPALFTGAVLHVCDSPMPHRVACLQRLCASRGLLFGQATVVKDQGVIGPVGQAARMSAVCPPAGEASPRTSAPAGISDGDGLAVGPVSDFLAGPTASLVANHLCVAFLRQAAGLPAQPDEVLEIDLETFRTRSRSLAAAGMPGEGVQP